MIPSFSRIEIRTETQSHLRTAARSIRELADQIDTIARRTDDNRLMRLAAHDAIREVSMRLRSCKSPS